MHLLRKNGAHALLILLALSMASCVGRMTREQSYPAVLSLLNDEFRANVDLGVSTIEPPEARIAANLTVENFYTAVRSKNPDTIVHSAWPMWEDIKGYAIAGIDERRSRYKADPTDPEGMPTSGIPILVGEVNDIGSVFEKFVNGYRK